jgi:peptidoglycan/LPS O-acetylase OafA/YrhL
MKRLDQLTFTRFLALLLVLFYHGAGGAYIAPFNFFPIAPLLYSAPTAVGYLYVLSGFVMALVYYRPEKKFDIAGYWITRFVRIYPLYIISFLLTCYYYLDFIARIKPRKVLVNVFVLQAWWPDYAQSFNYSSWSMTVEFFFYAIFPFFVLWAYRQPVKKLIWTSVIFWVASQTIHYVLWIRYFLEWEYFVAYFPLFHLNSFIMGVVGGIWYVKVGQTQNPRARDVLIILTGSILLAVLFTIAGGAYPNVPHNLQPMAGILAPIFTIAIVALAMDRTRLSAALSHPVLVMLGETAYALYILHVPVIWLVKRAVETWWPAHSELIFSYAYLPFMVAVGLLAHFYVDTPIRKWLMKIMQRISAPLALLDLALLSASVYLSFRLRFNPGREYDSYYTTMLLMFWSAFVLRTAFSIYFNSLNPAILYGTFTQFAKPVLLSVTAASIGMFAVVFIGYSIGWFENFPRSIFLVDWGIMLALSLLVRYLFRLAGFYAPKPLAA